MINYYEAFVILKKAKNNKAAAVKFVTSEPVTPWRPSLFLMKSIIINAGLAPKDIRHDREWSEIIGKYTVFNIKLIKTVTGAPLYDMERNYSEFKREACRNKESDKRYKIEENNISESESIPRFLRRSLSVFRNKAIGYSTMYNGRSIL